MPKKGENKEWPRVGCRVSFSCKKYKLMRRYISLLCIFIVLEPTKNYFYDSTRSGYT